MDPIWIAKTATECLKCNRTHSRLLHLVSTTTTWLARPLQPTRITHRRSNFSRALTAAKLSSTSSWSSRKLETRCWHSSFTTIKSASERSTLRPSSARPTILSELMNTMIRLTATTRTLDNLKMRWTTSPIRTTVPSLKASNYLRNFKAKCRIRKPPNWSLSFRIS